MLDVVQDRGQEAKAKVENGAGAGKGSKSSNGSNGNGSNGSARSRSREPRRAGRANGRAADNDLSTRALLTRLEEQSGQLGVLRSKLDEMRDGLARQRELARADREALEEERRVRERLEASLKREREARQVAVRDAEEANATASALEGQLQLVRAKLTTRSHGGRRWRVRRRR